MGSRALTGAGLVLISLSCGTSSPHVPLPELPSAETRATLVGSRCAGGEQCSCRDPGTEAKEDRPPEGYKRFEIRVGPTQNPLWVVVDDMVLYKSNARATDCFYVDLVPGEHPIRIHGKQEDGLGMMVQINELSGGGPWWYPTFEFDCGAGGLCDLNGIRAEQKRIAATPRGIHAPCGSVKVERLEWQTGTMPDSLHPGEIVVDFVLDVYKFATTERPGSEACDKKS